jgi:flagellar protein FliL
MALMAAVLLAGGGAGGWWYLSASGEATDAAVVERPPVFLPLESFTVNLQPERAHQYLQVGLTIKLANASALDAIKLHMPEIRSRILMVLSTKGPSELLTVEGKQKLADEVAAEVRQPLRDEAQARSVQTVVFTSFVIQ